MQQLEPPSLGRPLFAGVVGVPHAPTRCTTAPSGYPPMVVGRIGMFWSHCLLSRAVLNWKKVFRYTVFPKKPAGTLCVGGGQLAVGD